MAEDKLIFPIGFDLQKEVEEAGKDWDKYAQKLESALAKRAVKVKLSLDTHNLDNLDAVKQRLAQLKIEPITAGNKAAIKELIKELTALAKAMEKVSSLKEIELPELQTAKANKIRKDIEQADEKLRLQQGRTRQSNERLLLSQQRTETPAEKTSRAYGEQSSYLSGLLKQITAVWNTHLIRNFLTNVRDVTAEFELQRVSLGAIIQDQNRANQLFSEIKTFALKSPVSIMDLTKYTKQLAAYKIETNSLFDTTKRLADVSVGLGVSMDRIILAYGQVKATSYLRAAEIQQFTEAGIPMLELLAEKFTQIQGKAITTEQVLDMVSKRAVSFSLVEEIFKDMTDAGGMFYNMQEKQSQTLFGMWSKLGDAAAVMHEEIGNTGWVNEGMKAGISLLENMMRNWKTTARVLNTIAVALGVYVAGLKNAAIASKALTGVVALENLAHQQQIIRIPRIVAGLIGINNVKKVSTILTKAHTKAVLSEAAATNILTKGFWQLTAAMLANPWVLAAAAIAAVGAALFHFIGNTETAAERAEKLNDSVATFKNLNNTVAPLIDTYNELTNKTERTTAEEKKLSAVTHELAKRYPGAITAIGDSGNGIDLATDKLNNLYQAEKKARMENTRHELEKTEQKIIETEEKIARLQVSLQKGIKTDVLVNHRTGHVQTITVEMSDEDKGKVLQQIDELRYGKDGQSGLLGLQQSAEAAETAMKGITVDQLRIEKFGGWKKELQGFSKVVDGLNMGKPIRLFDDTTINGFKSLDDALQQTAKQYKDNKALTEQYADTLKSTTISPETRSQTEELKAEAEARAELDYAALKRFNALKLLQKSGSGNTCLQTLNEIERTLASINNKYEELVKKEGQTAALDYAKKNYASTLEYVNKLGKKFGLNFEMPTDFKDLQTYRKNIQKVIEALKMEGYEKAIIELELKVAEGNRDKLEKQIEKQLKELADKILHTKTAKEFYQKILDQTGDVNIATKVSMSIYGDTGEGLFDATVEQIKEVFKTGSEEDPTDIDISAAINITSQRINYKTLADIYAKYKDEMGEKARDVAQKIISEGQKTAAENMLTWEKELAKAKDFEQQRTDIINREAQRRAEIIKSNLPQEEKEQLVAQSRKKQEIDLADLDIKEFKSSETFIKMFENLDSVATSSLKRMRNEIKRVIETDKDMSPENMKAMGEAYEKMNDKISDRNPFANVIQGAKDYVAAIKRVKEKQDEFKTAQAEYDAQKPELEADISSTQQKKDVADADVAEKERVLLEIKQQEDILRKQEIIDEAQLAILRNQELEADMALVAAQGRQNIAATNLLKSKNKQAASVKKVKDKEDELNDAQNDATKAQNKFIKGVQQAQEFVSNLKSVLEGLEPIFGDLTSDATTLGNALNAMVTAMGLFQSIMEIVIVLQEVFNIATESNPWMAIAAAVLAVGAALASFIGAEKVRKANKEIEKQQEILDQLEYSYGRLEKAAEKAFGGDYIKNFKAQQANLQAQIEATQKQLTAEQSKGKKTDDDKVKEYKEQIRDLNDQLADMQGTLAEHFLGTDLTSAARDFAKAWLDAYKEFGNTADAMSEKFQEMIENMVVEGVMAAVMQRALEPAFKMIDEMDDGDFYSEDFWREVAAKAEQGAKDADAGAQTMMKFLEQAGLSIRDLGGDLTGISRDIAGASEESINGLAATMNTWSYYVSYVPQIAQNVATLRAILEGGGAPIQSGPGVTDLVTLQNQSLTHLQAINQHTAETVTECRRIAERCTAMAEDIHRVVVPKGTKGAYSMQVQMPA